MSKTNKSLSDTLKDSFRIMFSQIKKVITIQMAYPMDFITSIFTAVFVGLWFITLAKAVTSSDVSTDASFGAYAVWGLVGFFFYSIALWAIGRFI
ncbi:MAG: hypothetical protein ACTSPI_04075, partial [Candidatus Heimdallarchaeaceae archaeon]